MMMIALFGSHKTTNVLDTLLTNVVWLSSIPGGCTGLVRSLTISINTPFKIYERFGALRPCTRWLKCNIGYNTNTKIIIKENIKKDYKRWGTRKRYADCTTRQSSWRKRVMAIWIVGDAWKRCFMEMQQVMIRLFGQKERYLILKEIVLWVLYRRT